METKDSPMRTSIGSSRGAERITNDLGVGHEAHVQQSLPHGAPPPQADDAAGGAERHPVEGRDVFRPGRAAPAMTAAAAVAQAQTLSRSATAESSAAEAFAAAEKSSHHCSFLIFLRAAGSAKRIGR